MLYASSSNPWVRSHPYFPVERVLPRNNFLYKASLGTSFLQAFVTSRLPQHPTSSQIAGEGISQWAASFKSWWGEGAAPERSRHWTTCTRSIQTISFDENSTMHYDFYVIKWCTMVFYQILPSNVFFLQLCGVNFHGEVQNFGPIDRP